MDLQESSAPSQSASDSQPRRTHPHPGASSTLLVV